MLDKERIKILPQEEIRILALRGDIVLATKEGFSDLEEQIAHTKKEFEDMKAELGKVAQQDSDLPENTQFKEIKTKLQFELPRRMKDLLQMQNKTIIFEEKQDGTIRFGTKFSAELRYPQETTSGIFILVGPIEASKNDPEESLGAKPVSYLSPIGRAVWGYNPKKEQREIAFVTPAGKVSCMIKEVLGSNG